MKLLIYSTVSSCPSYRQAADPSREFVFLKESCQIVRPVAPSQVPNDGVADHVVLGTTVAFLEVVDLMASKVQQL